MRNLEQLRAKLEKDIARMEALNGATVNEKGEVRKFTKEESDEYSALERSTLDTKEAIKRHQEIEAGKAVVKDLDQPETRSTNVQITREADCNEHGEYRGYSDFKKGGFGDFLKDVMNADKRGIVSDKLKKLRAATGANEAIANTGGALVQSDHAEILESNAKGLSFIASKCTEIPVSSTSNSTTFKQLDETSLAVGSQFGGIQAFWRAEAGTVTQTKPKFKDVNVKLEALEALFYATDEQLDDSAQLGAFVSMAFQEAMSFQLDDAIIGGNGAGKPLGILNAPAAITIAAEGAQVASTLVYANVDKMTDRLLTGSSGIWLAHPDNKQQLRNLVNTPGAKTDFLVFQPAGGSVTVDTLFSRPVAFSQACRAKGIKGDFILADLTKYLLFKKSGIRASQSAHVAFLTGEQVFKWTLRVAGMPLYNTAITDAYGSTTRSSFVVLAARP